MLYAILSACVALFFAAFLLVAICRRKKYEHLATAAPSLFISDKDRKTMAYHEAGHAIVFANLFGKEHLKIVTIDPNNEAFGCTKFEEVFGLNQTYDDFIFMIATLLAGRIAEEKLLNLKTTSAIHDLNSANFFAREMVLKHGFGKSLGLLQIDENFKAFIPEKIKQKMADDICEILQNAESIAKKIIDEEQVCLKKLADVLIKQKTLSQNEIKVLLEKA